MNVSDLPPTTLPAIAPALEDLVDPDEMGVVLVDPVAAGTPVELGASTCSKYQYMKASQMLNQNTLVSACVAVRLTWSSDLTMNAKTFVT